MFNCHKSWAVPFVMIEDVEAVAIGVHFSNVCSARSKR